MSSAISTAPARPTTERELSGGRDLVLVIDVQGARQVRSHGANAIGIFVLPPSFEALERRLRGRSKDSEEAIRKRLVTARREIRAVAEYEYVDRQRRVGCVRGSAAVDRAGRARAAAGDGADRRPDRGFVYWKGTSVNKFEFVTLAAARAKQLLGRMHAEGAAAATSWRAWP